MMRVVQIVANRGAEESAAVSRTNSTAERGANEATMSSDDFNDVEGK